MIASFLLLASGQSANPFDRAIELISKASKGSFTVEYSSRENAINRKGRYEVAYVRPDRLRLRTIAEGNDRTYTLVGTTLYGIDSRAKEYLSTKAGTKGGAVDRMGVVVPVDEPIRLLVDPAVGKNFLSTMKGLGSWKQPSKGVFERRESNGAFRLGFDSSGRLSNVRVEGPAGALTWSYRYGAGPSTVSFRRPSGYRKVENFYDAMPDRAPKYANAATRARMEATLRAYSRLRHVVLTVDADGKPFDVWMSDRKIRQRTAEVDWAWDGSVLRMIHRPTKTFRVGNVKRSAVEETLGRSSISIDPLLRKLARGENPISSLINGDLSGKIVGQIASGGAPCDIVELKATGIRLTFTIRRDNGLLVASSTENTDSSGRRVSSSDRRYEYKSVGKPLPAATFVLQQPAGYRRVGW